MFFVSFCVFFQGVVYASKSSAEKLLMLSSIDKNMSNRILILKVLNIYIKANVMLHKKCYILDSCTSTYNLSHYSLLFFNIAYLFIQLEVYCSYLLLSTFENLTCHIKFQKYRKEIYDWTETLK